MSSATNDYEKQQLLLAKDFITAGEYEEAERVLLLIQGNPTAQNWLERLEDLKKVATQLPDTGTVKEKAQRQKAVQEIERRKQGISGFGRISSALLIFFGSLLGSGIGAVADFSEGYDTMRAGYAEVFYPRLCVVGSSTILEPGLGMAEAWAEDFEEDHQVRVKIEATGSSEGVKRAIAGDCVHILAMSEALSEKQYNELVAAGYEVKCAVEIGYDAIVFVTDIYNDIPAIEWRDVRRIYQGTTTSWLSVRGSTYLQDRNIIVLLREGSGTTDHVLSKVALLPLEPFPPQNNARYVTCSSNEDCLNKSLTLEGSIHGLSAAWIRTQDEGFYRVLPILSRDDAGAISPLDANFSPRDYPKVLVRPLYMYVLSGVVEGNEITEEKLQNAEAFLEYVRGTSGQKILRDHYFYTHFDRAIFGTDPDDADYQVSISLELPPDFPILDENGLSQACKR